MAKSVIGTATGISAPPAGENEPKPDDAHKDDSSGSFIDPEALSTTIVEDVNIYVRLPLVFVNMLVLLFCLLGLLSSLYTLLTRSAPPGAPGRHFVVVLFQRPEIAALFLSSVMFVVASFGFLGALRENVTFLTVYVNLLSVLALLLLVSAGLVFTLPSAVRHYFEQSVSRDMISAYRESAELQAFVDWMQLRYRCCGVSSEGFRDWNLNEYFACDSDNLSRERCQVPATCCRRNESTGRPPAFDCASNVLQASDQVAWTRIYTRSCSEALFTRFSERVFPASMLVLALCLATLFLVALAIATREQVLTLSAIYDVYYRRLEEGQAIMVARDTSGFQEAKVRRQSRSEQQPPHFWTLLREAAK